MTLPPLALFVSSHMGDFDGDGAPDRLFVYGLETSKKPEEAIEWRARLVLSYGYATDIPLLDAAAPRFLGSYDINGKGEEVFIEVNSGASTGFAAIYTFVGCNLLRARERGGEDSTYGFGGSAMHFDSLQCDRQGVTHYQFESANSYATAFNRKANR